MAWLASCSTRRCSLRLRDGRGPSFSVPDGALHHVPREGGRRRDGLPYLEEVPGRPHGVAGRRERVLRRLPCALSIPAKHSTSWLTTDVPNAELMLNLLMQIAECAIYTRKNIAKRFEACGSTSAPDFQSFRYGFPYLLDTAPETTLDVAASDLLSAASTASITLSAR